MCRVLNFRLWVGEIKKKKKMKRVISPKVTGKSKQRDKADEYRDNIFTD